MKTYEEKKAETDRLLALLPEVREELMHIPGVVRVTVGMRERGGKLEQEILFRVHVEQKLPESALAPNDVIPKTIRGVPVDVIVKRLPQLETGFKDDTNDDRKYRPIVGGISVSAEDANPDIPGTMGCICRRTTDNKVVFVSNWHVLIDPGGAIGNGAGQPKWRKKCCCVCDRVGTVLDFDKALDCAIAEIDAKTPWAPKIRRIIKLDGTVEEEGKIAGGTAPVATEGVYKVGMRTGLTYGFISDIDPVQTRVEVTPDAEFSRMSAPGDSGSVYVSITNHKVMALHNAGDGRHGFGIPFDLVMARLKIEVIPTPDDVSFAVLDRAVEAAAENYVPSADDVFQQIAERLQQTVAGRALLGIIETHRDEIMDLINTRRRVTVTWHRAEGPAFLAAFLRSVQDDAYIIPEHVRGITRRDAVIYMSAALRDTGSEALRADIDVYGDRIIRALTECATVSELLGALDASAEVTAHG